MNGIFILGEDGYQRIYGGEVPDRFREVLRIDAPPQTPESMAEHPELLGNVQVLMTGWGGPVMDADFFAAAPYLQLVLYGAGSVRPVVTDEFWQRDIPITSGYGANAVAVGDFVLAEILFSLKRGWHFTLRTKELGRFPSRDGIAGCYGASVGLIGLGQVGRRIAEVLKRFDLHVLAYDPHVKADIAKNLDVELTTLADLFARADVVSLHAANVPDTRHLVGRELLDRLKPYATFINTSRGALVDEDALLAFLREREDVYAVLDVTDPEPPVEGSPLYELPNVVLTPHIAGALGPECQRMGMAMLDELKRFLNGEPLRWRITKEMLEHGA